MSLSEVMQAQWRHDDDDRCDTHDHAMVFHSCVCAEILFKGWNTSNELQLFGSALAIFVAAALYEGFKNLRETLAAPAPAPASAAAHGSQNNIVKTELGAAAGAASNGRSMWSGGHLVQTALHLVQSVLSYLLMLVFMTYNVWLCLAVVLGLTLGYFVCGWRRAALHDRNDHCQ